MYITAYKRPITKDDYDAINWLNYYCASERSYDESMFHRVVEILEEIIEDEDDAAMYGRWIMNAANGRQVNWHRMQDFCIEILSTYRG